MVPVLLASQDSGDSEAIRGQSTPTFDSGEAVGGIEEIVRSWPALSTNGVNNDNLRRDVTGRVIIHGSSLVNRDCCELHCISLQNQFVALHFITFC